jgi:hypothetical protein
MRRALPAAALSVFALVAPVTVQPDRTPPVFAGLRSAITCIPGPVDGDQSSIYHLAWPAASDNRTPQRRIVYDVYRASAPASESFATPTYVTRPGATSFATPPLSSTGTYYFVVRARDAAGNHDRNRRERRGVNICY